MKHPHIPEPTKCRACGTMFDLARQPYYTDLCPSCADAESPGARKMPCDYCGEREYPEHMRGVRAHLDFDMQVINVCSEGCARLAARPPDDPRPAKWTKGANKYRKATDDDPETDD